MVTPEELRQLQAFARYDGLVVGLMMSATFIMTIYSLAYPGMQFLVMALLISTPLFVWVKACRYRDRVVMKRVSFRRAWYYAVQCFLYGGLILSLVGYVYMRFIDGGMFMQMLNDSLSQPEAQEMLKQYDIPVGELQEMIGSQRPIDIAFSLFTNVLFWGFAASLFIAILMGRNPKGAGRQY